MKPACARRSWLAKPLRRRQAAGAALLAALLTVALVATFAAQAYWQQWRSVEIESADRRRLQLEWLQLAALDWSRALLRADGLRGNPIDHADEPWAQPVRDLALDDFLAGSGSGAPGSPAREALQTGAVLSLQLSDAQGKLNLLNLLEGQSISPVWLRAFEKLFTLLQLPPAQLASLVQNLRAASARLEAPGADRGPAPLLPQQMAQLVWLGLEPATVALLASHVTILPARSSVNLNSASVQVLQAVWPGLTRTEADRVLALRQFRPLQAISEVGASAAPGEAQVSLGSRFFELHTEVGLGPVRTARNALLQRDGADVRILWVRPALASGTSPALPARP
jgi:general secretion pathway protein K